MLQANRQTTTGRLIEQLNPVIRGWAQYHRHVVSKRAFSTVDQCIFWMLWRWAKRRHPNKSAKWIKKRYFSTHEARNWVFLGEVTRVSGETRQIRLFSAANVPIRRHIKLQGRANPYDPAWEPYFAKRLGVG
jgi:RNA-directed DNA polymerase